MDSPNKKEIIDTTIPIVVAGNQCPGLIAQFEDRVGQGANQRERRANRSQEHILGSSFPR